MTKDNLYIIGQFLLFGLYFFDIDLWPMSLPTWFTYVAIATGFFGGISLIFGVLQLNENLTPFPRPKSNSELVTHGVYSLVRHPIYTGLVLTLLSYALKSESEFRLMITLVLFVLFYFKTELEEAYLMDRYPDYAEYKVRTGRFFPKIRLGTSK